MEEGRRAFDSSSLSVSLEGDAVGQLRVVLAFMEIHTGPAHRVRNRVRGTRQTLYCTCGLPSPPPVLREEDLDYG